jgi:hypothetical protein
MRRRFRTLSGIEIQTATRLTSLIEYKLFLELIFSIALSTEQPLTTDSCSNWCLCVCVPAVTRL